MAMPASAVNRLARVGMPRSLLELDGTLQEAAMMRAMIARRWLVAAGVLLAAGSAKANPIEDCNQSADLDLQIAGCTRFLQQDPFGDHVALAYGLRGGAYRSKGDLRRAIDDFDLSLEIDPRQTRVYVNRGLVYRDKGDLDQAIADFTKAIEIDSQYGDAWVNRCVAYVDQGQPDLGIADCSKAIALAPEDAVAFNDRGVAYEKKGDVDNALADYSKAIELDPNYGEAYANRAVVYDHNGEQDRAIADYRAALKFEPSDEDRVELEAALKRLEPSP